ncbi:MAG: hypothetical protein M1826_000364 [Phylliscum demangeonii]|nr:MAG: hypothetical protein M1826_000364 [Phylliscum demangeonii]
MALEAVSKPSSVRKRKRDSMAAIPAEAGEPDPEARPSRGGRSRRRKKQREVLKSAPGATKDPSPSAVAAGDGNALAGTEPRPKTNAATEILPVDGTRHARAQERNQGRKRRRRLAEERLARAHEIEKDLSGQSASEELLSATKKDKLALRKTGAVEEEVATRKRQEKRKIATPKQSVPGPPAWHVSPVLGGRLIDADPILSHDERHLILARPSTINVYATNTSSLVRSFAVASSSAATTDVTAYALSSTQPTQLYVGTHQGILHLFDWVEGKKLGRWELGAEIWGLAVCAHGAFETTLDLVYAREQRAGRWEISTHSLRRGEDAMKTMSRTVLSLSSPITLFRLLRDGQVIVAASGKRLLVGHRIGDASVSVKEMKYIWREWNTADHITCIDVRDPTEGRHRRARALQQDPPAVDVLLGHTNGAIYLFEDVLSKLLRQEGPKTDQRKQEISPRRMHWHREAVRSVKWTLDGEYVLSGGMETVLVIWHLSSNRQDFLPHLSSPIDSIVVTASGRGYMIKLADNSTMILSSSELKPRTYLGGIQAPVMAHRLPPRMGPGSADHFAGELRVPAVPATISSQDPSQLLLAVPTTPAAYPGAPTHSPYLQTVDLATGHHLSRQPLTRTNVTDVNVGPEYNKILEPNVTFVRASHDGRWLATVDEWSPPRQDLRDWVVDEDELRRERHRRTEVCLKFWCWDAAAMRWDLATKVDAPHPTAIGCDGDAAGYVLDLQPDPSTLAFATAGDDGAIRIWRAQPRRVHDQVVYNERADAVMDWQCEQVIPLGSFAYRDLRPGRAVHLARLAYSHDGSVLAASQPTFEDGQLGLMHFVNARSGELQRTQAGWYTGAIAALAFVERFLVIVADHLMVWDTVQARLRYGFSLPASALAASARLALTHLAVAATPLDAGSATATRTFAIALPLISTKAGKQGDEALTVRALRVARSQIVILDPRQPRPLHCIPVPRLATALVALVGAAGAGAGYVVLDAAAQMRLVSHKPTALALALAAPSDSPLAFSWPAGRGLPHPLHPAAAPEPPTGLALDLDRAAEDARPRPRRPEDAEDEDEEGDGLPVVRQEQLAQIFDPGSASALPPLRHLFEKVAMLFSSKHTPAGVKARPAAAVAVAVVV